MFFEHLADADYAALMRLYIIFFVILLQGFADIVGVAILTVAGDHLSKEACKEHLESKKDSYKSQIEQRLVCHRTECKSVCLLDEFLDYDPDGKNTTSQEHQDTCKTEEVHRLLAESA